MLVIDMGADGTDAIGTEDVLELGCGLTKELDVCVFHKPDILHAKIRNKSVFLQHDGV